MEYVPASEQTASEVVSNSMVEYAKYAVASKLPSPIDGLKPIHRRIIWVLKDVDRMIKGGTAVGNVLKKHPHGDAAIWDTMVHMMRDFENTHPMVTGHGSIGSYDGEDAAAPRYLDVSRSDFAMDVYFNGINISQLDYQPDEMGDGIEVAYFVPKVPMALINASFGVAVGFSSKVLPYNFQAICKMAIENIRAKKSINSAAAVLSTHPDWFLPDSYIPTLLRNVHQIRSNVRAGQFENIAIYDGTMELNPGSITIRTLPFGVSAKGLYLKLDAAVNDRNSVLYGMVTEAVDSSSSQELEIELPLKRGVDVFEALDIVKRFIRFTAKQHPNMQWAMDDGQPVELGFLGVLDTWYEARHKSVMADFNDRQIKLAKRHRELEAKNIVIDHADAVVKIVRSSKTRDSAIASLCKRFNLTVPQAKYLSVLTLIQLTAQGRDELQEQMQKVREELAELKHKFTNIDEIIISSITVLMDKYKLERKAKYPDFRGAMQTETGVIQYWDNTERALLIDQFKPENISLLNYPAGRVYRYACLDCALMDEEELSFPKELRVDKWIVSKRKLNQTICLRTDESLIYRNNLLVYRKDEPIEFVPVGDTFTAITDKGVVTQEQTTSVPLRKATVSSGIKTAITHVTHVVGDDLIIVHGNSATSEKNVIRMDRVKPGDKLNKLPMGDLIVLGVYQPGEPFVINIPKNILHRNTTHHLTVEDAAACLAGRNSIRIYVNKSRSENGCRIGSKPVHGVPVLNPPASNK